MLIDTAGATDLDQAMQLLQLLMAGGCACHVLCESCAHAWLTDTLCAQSSAIDRSRPPVP